MYRYRARFRLLLLMGFQAVCSCGPGEDDADGGGAIDAGVATDDAAGLDGIVADADSADAENDASIDAGLDAGGACVVEHLPVAEMTVCTLEEATCYRECPDRACTSGCGVIFLSDCGQCVGAVTANCAIDHCPEANASWACCLRTLCPSGGECPECDEERAAIRACLDATYNSFCRAELEVCFP